MEETSTTVIRKGFSWASLCALVLAILACFGIGWSAFVKPTTTNKLADGATQNNYFEKPSIPLGGCALWRVNIKATWDTSTSAVGKTVEDKK